MKYLQKIFTLILFSFLMSCKTYVPASDDRIYTLINKTYSGKEILYHKTLGKQELETFIGKVDLTLWNNNLSKSLIKGGEVDYKEIFQKEDLDLIIAQLKRQVQSKLDSKLIKTDNLLTNSNSSGGIHQISQPIYNRDQSFCLVFRKKVKGGEDIVVYEMVNSEWKIHSVITLSMV